MADTDNNFNYIIIQTSQGIDLEVLGYDGGRLSSDGAYIVVDKDDGTTTADIGYAHSGPIPTWITDITGGGSDATHEQARALVRAPEFRGV